MWAPITTSAREARHARRGRATRTSCTIVLATLLCGAGAARAADAPGDPRGPSAGRIAGATLGAFGAAAAVGAGVGSLAHLVRREHTGAWGWINLLAGALMGGGGMLLVRHGGAATQVGGHLTICFGVLSFGTGLAGLSLQRPEAQAPLWRRWRLQPTWLQAGQPGAGSVPGLVWHGVL